MFWKKFKVLVLSDFFRAFNRFRFRVANGRGLLIADYLNLSILAIRTNKYLISHVVWIINRPWFIKLSKSVKIKLWFITGLSEMLQRTKKTFLIGRKGLLPQTVATPYLF